MGLETGKYSHAKRYRSRQTPSSVIVPAVNEMEGFLFAIGKALPTGGLTPQHQNENPRVSLLRKCVISSPTNNPGRRVSLGAAETVSNSQAPLPLRELADERYYRKLKKARGRCRPFPWRMIP